MSKREVTYRGIVRNVRFREKSVDTDYLQRNYGESEYISDTYLTFRIEQMDDEGNTLGYIPVQLKGEEIVGNLVDGDEVEVVGCLSRGGIIQPRRVFNIKTNTEMYVTVRSTSLFAFIPGCIFLFLFGFVFFSVIFLFLNILSNWNNFGPPGQPNRPTQVIPRRSSQREYLPLFLSIKTILKEK